MRRSEPDHALSTPKLEALRYFARELIHNRGKVAHADVAAFMDAGYTDAQALEVVLGLAMKLMSNYTNSIAGTPLDKEVQKFHWEKPKIKPREMQTTRALMSNGSV